MKYNTEIIKILKKDLEYYEKKEADSLAILKNVNDLDEDQIQDYHFELITNGAIARYISDLLLELE